MHAGNAFLNTFQGASTYAFGKGLHSIGADDNSFVIFSDLMDSKSLFLTANADTIYYMTIVDLAKGPMVVEVPPSRSAASTICGSAGSSTPEPPAQIGEKVANI